MEYKTTADPRATTPDGVPVFCSFDEIVPIKTLKPNPGNPNKHGQHQLDLLGAIIKSTGWRAAITVSKRSGLMVKGHGRRMAALFQNLKYVPVEYQDYSSEAEEHADLIADNRIAELAELDMNKLTDMIQNMDTGEIPVELTGFTEDDLAKILAAIEGADDVVDDRADAEVETPAEKPKSKLGDRADAEVETPAEKPKSKLGDLWHLGSHRLLCGSATDAADIERLMQGRQAQMVHTDPPYGVTYCGGNGGGRKVWDMVKNDNKEHDELMTELLIPAFKNYMKNTVDDAAFYIWYASRTGRDFQDAMTAVGLVEKQQIIWAKSNFAMGRADYQWKHEPCFYCEKQDHSAKWYGDRTQTTLWNVVLRGKDGTATTLHGGVVLTDGKGGKLYLNEQAPKGKKVRYIRLSEGRSVTLYPENKESTVWEIQKESGYIHPTQKPVEIPCRAISNSSDTGDLVLDFFCGSGSTLIAAEMLGRVCYSTELAPEYVDKIVKRYIDLTGNESVTCERDGKEYNYKEIFSDNGVPASEAPGENAPEA